MTMPYYDVDNMDYSHDNPEEESAERDNIGVIPVRVEGTMNERVAPEFAACMTWPIPQAGNGDPVNVLPRRYHRYKAKMQVLLSVATATLILNSKRDPVTGANPQGYTVNSGGSTIVTLPEWDSMQPLYVICVGGTATLSVLDESYGQVQ